MKPWAIVLLAISVVAPVAAYVGALAVLPDTVPVHFGFDGQPDRWGSKHELLPVGFILSGCNLLIALCYAFAPALKRMGLLNAPRNNDVGIARVILVVTALACAALAVGILFFIYGQVNSVL